MLPYTLINVSISVSVSINNLWRSNTLYYELSAETAWTVNLLCSKTNFRALLKYCSLSTVVLQYQYQGFGIVLQYKTARLVHPCNRVKGLNVGFIIFKSITETSSIQREHIQRFRQKKMQQIQCIQETSLPWMFSMGKSMHRTQNRKLICLSKKMWLNIRS